MPAKGEGGCARLHGMPLFADHKPVQVQSITDDRPVQVQSTTDDGQVQVHMSRRVLHKGYLIVITPLESHQLQESGPQGIPLHQQIAELHCPSGFGQHSLHRQ